VVLTPTPLKGVEGRLDHMAWDARSQGLFAASVENHTVEVVDLAKRRRALGRLKD